MNLGTKWSACYGQELVNIGDSKNFELNVNLGYLEVKIWDRMKSPNAAVVTN